MSALDTLGRELAAAGRAIVRAPVLAYRWLVDNASRVLAILWLGGMAFVLVMTLRRVIKHERAERDDPAQVAAAAAEAANGDGPEQVVQLMDVDEMNAIQDQRMHALGLAAAGDSGDPDQAAIDAARAERGKSDAPVGDRAGGAGNVVVVSKGGIAGWIARNKGKKPDPETLAWLRGEEKAEGRGPYAQWADQGDGDLMSWMMKNKKHAAGAGSGAATGSGSGSEAGTGTTGATAGDSGGSSTVTPVAPVVVAPVVVTPMIDMHELGTAAVRAMSPVAAAEQRQAMLATLQARLAAEPATAALVPHARARQIVIPLPAAALFASDSASELTPGGTVMMRRLGRIVAGVHDRDLELRAAPDRALELAAALAIGGVNSDHLALAAVDAGSGSGDGSDAPPLELVLLESP